MERCITSFLYDKNVDYCHRNYEQYFTLKYAHYSLRQQSVDKQKYRNMSGTFQLFFTKQEKNKETKVKITKIQVDFCKKERFTDE